MEAFSFAGPQAFEFNFHIVLVVAAYLYMFGDSMAIVGIGWTMHEREANLKDGFMRLANFNQSFSAVAN